MEERLEKYLKYIDTKINELRDTTTDLASEEANEMLVTVLFALMTIMTFMVVMLAFTIQSFLLLMF